MGTIKGRRQPVRKAREFRLSGLRRALGDGVSDVNVVDHALIGEANDHLTSYPTSRRNSLSTVIETERLS